jgi:D-alanyl-D-alanine carboxypeptidase (penicillin-binding protein 5/6)
MRRYASLLCAVLFFIICIHSLAHALEPVPDLSAIAYVLYDGDYDYVILGKNAEQLRSIASLTKLMTLLCAVELVEAGEINLDDVITASARAESRDGTQIKLRAGDRFTLEELLYATALVSANDAAVAVAEYVAGSEAQFCRLMNEKAKALGLTNTNYTDCTGLISIFSNNYSTALDQAKLLRAGLEHDLFRKILGTQEYYLKAQDRKIVNTHPLLELPGVEGGKTGATTPAGHTLATSVQVDGRRLISVILGARSREVRNEEAKILHEWAEKNLVGLISKEQVLTPVLVPDGVLHEIQGVLASDFSLVAVSEEDLEFDTKVELLPNLRAPIDRGDKVGELVILRDKEEFLRLDIVAHQSTGLASWLRRIFNKAIHFFKGLGR